MSKNVKMLIVLGLVAVLLFVAIMFKNRAPSSTEEIKQETKPTEEVPIISKIEEKTKEKLFEELKATSNDDLIILAYYWETETTDDKENIMAERAYKKISDYYHANYDSIMSFMEFVSTQGYIHVSDCQFSKLYEDEYSQAYTCLNNYLGKDMSSVLARFKRSPDVEFVSVAKLRQWGYDSRYSFGAQVKINNYGEVLFVITANNQEGLINEVYITCDESFGKNIDEDFKKDDYFCEFTTPNENGSTSKFIKLDRTRVAVVKNTLWMMEIKCNEVKLY